MNICVNCESFLFQYNCSNLLNYVLSIFSIKALNTWSIVCMYSNSDVNEKYCASFWNLLWFFKVFTILHKLNLNFLLVKLMRIHIWKSITCCRVAWISWISKYLLANAWITKQNRINLFHSMDMIKSWVYLVYQVFS